jgi:hypothetical protein
MISNKEKSCRIYKKIFFSSIQESPSDFFLIDFRNEMWQTATLQNSLFTFSDYFKEIVWNADYYTKHHLEKESPYLYLEDTLKLLPEFIRQLKTLYPTEKIILHEAYLANTYRSKENEILPFHKVFQQEIATANAFMTACHEAFRKYDASLKILSVEDRYRIADESHRWTISPAHFIPEYNQRFLEILQALTHPSTPTGPISRP